MENGTKKQKEKKRIKMKKKRGKIYSVVSAVVLYFLY